MLLPLHIIQELKTCCILKIMIVNCMFKPKRQIAISRNPNRPSRTLSETEIGQDVQVASLMKDENQRKGTCLEKLTY